MSIIKYVMNNNVGLTPERAVECMKECDELDIEDGHIQADMILCRIAELNGYAEAVEEYKKLDKWYS